MLVIKMYSGIVSDINFPLVLTIGAIVEASAVVLGTSGVVGAKDLKYK